MSPDLYSRMYTSRIIRVCLLESAMPNFDRVNSLRRVVYCQIKCASQKIVSLRDTSSYVQGLLEEILCLMYACKLLNINIHSLGILNNLPCHLFKQTTTGISYQFYSLNCARDNGLLTYTFDLRYPH